MSDKDSATYGFTTKDLGLAAFLVTNGQQVERVFHKTEKGKRKNKTICYFHFEDQSACRALSSQFATSSHRSFYINVIKLKDRMFNRLSLS